MPVSSPAVGPLVFRLAVIAALTAVLVGAPAIGRSIGIPFGWAVEPAAAADGGCGRYQPAAPAGGVVRSVSNQEELTAALAAARPGDTVNLATGTYTRVDYRREKGHQSGTASAPIVIQAEAGATPVVDAGDNGHPSRRFAVSIDRMAHVAVRGLEIRNGIFGALSRGSVSITFEHTHIHHVGQVGVATGAAEGPSGLEPSSDTTIRCNSIHHTGMLDHEYGEGIYVGTGKTGAVDRTSDVLIEGNEIHTIANEAIDVKRHTTNVTVRHNLIHDVTPYYGGAISLGLNKNNWGPANYLVEHNKIWNVSSGRHYAQAIAVAHGPTTIRNNTIWNIESRITDSWPWTAPIQVHGDDSDADWAYGFGNPAATAVQIVGNTVIGCNQGCIDSYTDPGQIKPILSVQSNVVDRASTGDAVNGTDIVVSASDLVGPVSGDADAGSGPGSGLLLRSTPTTTVPSPTPTTSPAPTTSPSSTTVTAPPSTASQPPPPIDTTTSTTARAESSSGPTSGSPAPWVPADRIPTVATAPIADAPGRRSPPPGPVNRSKPTAPPNSRPPGSETTIRQLESTSTTRPAPQLGVRSRAAAAWRRGPSDFQRFLEINLDSASTPSSEQAGAAMRVTPESPAWLVAMMTPARQDKAAGTSATTVVARALPSAGNATTAIDGSVSGRSFGTIGADVLPSTTRPASTAGLTSVGDVVARTTMP